VYSVVRQIFRGRAYLYLFCALALGCLVGLSCSSDKGCTRPTVPDHPRLGPKTWLDLDEDGAADFLFEYIAIGTDDVPQSAMAHILYVRPLGSDSVQCEWPRPRIPLPDSTLIDATLGWAGSADLAHISWDLGLGWDSCWTGPWAGVSEMSLGLQLVRENSSYYGWVKISVDAETGSLTVHDYAYNFREGLPVRAGVHPPLYCSQKAGWTGLALILLPTDPLFPSGRYDVHLTPEGGATLSCYFVVSDDPEECGFAPCVTSGDCSAMYYAVGSPRRANVWLQYAVIQGPIEVVVERDGVIVGAATFEPVYEVVYPNGPECPPTCHQFTAELTVE